MLKMTLVLLSLSALNGCIAGSESTSQPKSDPAATAVAAIHSKAEVQELLASGRASALDYLAPDARRAFVDSLDFMNGEVSSYDYTFLARLSNQQRIEVLGLFGKNPADLLYDYRCAATTSGECLTRQNYVCDPATCHPPI